MLKNKKIHLPLFFTVETNIKAVVFLRTTNVIGISITSTGGIIFSYSLYLNNTLRTSSIVKANYKSQILENLQPGTLYHINIAARLVENKTKDASLYVATCKYLKDRLTNLNSSMDFTINRHSLNKFCEFKNDSCKSKAM